MLGKLRQILGPATATPAQADPAARIRLSVAALLVEMARADYEEQAGEQHAIVSLIKRHFQLDDADAAELLREARTAADDAVSLREFTASLHASLSYPDKLNVIGMLWDVALQDRSLDKYEDYLVGKLAELLYVARGDVIRLRHAASQRRIAGE